MSLFTNRGQGSFFPERRVNLNATRYTLHDVATGDFNLDGAGDFAVAVDDIAATPTRAMVLVYRNSGTGTFGTPAELTISGFFPQCLAFGEVTNDGVNDLVACHGTRTAQSDPLGLVTPLRGASTGTFTVGTPTIVGSAPSQVAIGNLDGDGFVDVAVADPDNRSISILYGNGTASVFAAPVILTDTISGPSAILIADVGDGGLPELLVTTSPPPSHLLIYRQTAPRTFAAPTSVPVGFLPSAMGRADFTGDGIADLVILTRQGLELFRGTGSSFTLAEIVSIGTSFDSLAVGDLNGDTKPDVAAVSSTSDRLTVVLNGADAPPTPGPTATITPSPSRTVTPGGIGPTPTRTSTAGVRTSTPTRTVTGTPTITPTPTITRTPLGPGDANCDGVIDQNDIDGVITRIFVPGCSAADVDGDGRVTAADLLLIVQMVAGS